MDQQTDGTSMRQAALAGSVGNIIEWYDWGAYAAFAFYLSHQFFPPENAAAALISTFAVFAVGFIARPIGSVTLGRLTDRVGRRTTLTVTVLIMCATSFMIGIAPTEATIGIWAAILLTAIRIIQGLALGAETSAVASFLIESAHTNARGRMVSLYGATASIGALLGAFVGLILTAFLTSDQMNAFGWRIPFIIGGFLGIIAFFIRRHGKETLHPHTKPVEKPVRTLLHTYPKIALRIFILGGAMGLVYFTMVMSFPPVAQALGANPGATYAANSIALALLVVLGPLAGMLSDRIGRRPVLLFGYFATAAVVIPVIALLWDPTQVWRVYAAQLIVVIPFAAIVGPVTAPLLEQLPQNLRGVGYGFVWACAIALFGGTGPMISTWLAARGINFTMGAYFLVMLIFAGILTFTMKETAFSPMPAESER